MESRVEKQHEADTGLVKFQLKVQSSIVTRVRVLVWPVLFVHLAHTRSRHGETRVFMGGASQQARHTRCGKPMVWPALLSRTALLSIKRRQPEALQCRGA